MRAIFDIHQCFWYTYNTFSFTRWHKLKTFTYFAQIFHDLFFHGRDLYIYIMMCYNILQAKKLYGACKKIQFSSNRLHH